MIVGEGPKSYPVAIVPYRANAAVDGTIAGYEWQEVCEANDYDIVGFDEDPDVDADDSLQAMDEDEFVYDLLSNGKPTFAHEVHTPNNTYCSQAIRA